VLGSEGTLSLPDPNRFEGKVLLRQGGGDWAEVSYASRGLQEARGIGLHDLAEAIAADREPRASGALAHHVVDIARSILDAAANGSTVEIRSTANRPDPLPVEAPMPAVDGNL
jgi:predicted dehydrogenase